MSYADVPISFSSAETFSVPQTVNAPFNVVYGAGNRVGGDTEVSPVNTATATATSSAALGGNATSSTGEQSFGGLSTNKLLVIGGVTAAVIAVGIVGYVIYKRNHH